MNPPSTQQHGPASLVRLGGSLGIAACIVGLLIFLVGCMGFNSVFPFSVLPLLLASVGIVIALAGAVQQRTLVIEDTHVLVAVFVNFLGIFGGLLEMAVWLKWPIFYSS